MSSRFFDLVEKALDAVLILMMVGGWRQLHLHPGFLPLHCQPGLRAGRRNWRAICRVDHLLGGAVVIPQRRTWMSAFSRNRLPRPVTAILYLVADLVVLFFLGAVGVGLSLDHRGRPRQLSPPLEFPMSFAYAAMRLEAVLMFLFLTATIFREWREGRRIGGGDQL